MVTTENQKIPKLRFPEFSGEWNLYKLGDQCNFTQGVQIPMTEQNKTLCEGYIRYLYIRDFFTDDFLYFVKDIYKTKIIEPHEIMMVNTGNTAGKAFKGKRGVLSNNSFKISFDEKKVNSDFLFIKLTSEHTQKRIKRFFNSGGQPHLGHKNIALVEFNCPPLSEQQKIASFLSSVDIKIEQLSNKKALLEQYKKGMMQKLFNQEIRFKDDDGNDYPEWDWRELGEVAVKSTEKNINNDYSRVFTNSATLGIVNQSDYFDHEVANSNNLEGYYIVKRGDFVYNPRISVHAPVGPIKLNENSIGVMSPLYTVFRFKEGGVAYFKQFFFSTYWHRYMFSVANYGARFDRMNISQRDFLAMPIPFPLKPEQQKIANFLSAIDQKIELVSAELVQAKTFKKGLLQQMFI